MRLSLAALALLCSCKSGPTCSLTAPDAGDGRLTTDGRLLRDSLGRVVQLRGVDMGGRSKFAPFAPFDFPDGGYSAALDVYLDRAAGWGIDVARVPFTWEAVEPTQGMDDAEFLSRYDALLAGLWKRGIRSVVDFHQDIYAAVYCGDGFPAWTLPGPLPAPHHDCPDWGSKYLGDPDVSAAFDRFWANGSQVQLDYQALWDRIAARYAQTPGVIGFEPFNEPGWGSADLSQWEPGVLTPFFTTMIARVQAKSPGSLVFFEGAGSDGVFDVTSLDRPDGGGIVYAPHYYQLAPDLGTIEPGMRYFIGRGATWNVPVFFGEFGVDSNEADAGALMAAHWNALESLGASGTEWEYSTAVEAWNSEHLGVTEADGSEDVTVAALVRPYLRALAGSAASVSRDGSTVTFSFTAAAGITEIAVPARTVPNGYDVDIAGACADSTHAGSLLVKADDSGQAVTVTLRPR